MKISEIRERFSASREESEPAHTEPPDFALLRSITTEPPDFALLRSITTKSGAHATVTLLRDGLHVLAHEDIRNRGREALKEWFHQIVREASFGYRDRPNWYDYAVWVSAVDSASRVGVGDDYIASIRFKIEASPGTDDAFVTCTANTDLATLHIPFPVTSLPEFADGS